jgi:hypothetical protein
MIDSLILPRFTFGFDVFYDAKDRLERAVQQGPVYDGSIPILTYRKYHYIRRISKKFLAKE